MLKVDIGRQPQGDFELVQAVLVRLLGPHQAIPSGELVLAGLVNLELGHASGLGHRFLPLPVVSHAKMIIAGIDQLIPSLEQVVIVLGDVD